MQYSKLAAATGIALLLAGGSLAIAQQSGYGAPSASTAAQATPHSHHGRGQFRHLLSPEERAMWRMDHRAQMASMNHEQRKAYKRQLRDAFVAMNGQEQAKVRDKLKQEWASLAPAQQQKIEQRIAMHEQKHASQHGRAGQPNYSGEMAAPQSPRASSSSNQL